jgi:hypothetical protein
MESSSPEKRIAEKPPAGGRLLEIPSEGNPPAGGRLLEIPSAENPPAGGKLLEMPSAEVRNIESPSALGHSTESPFHEERVADSPARPRNTEGPPPENPPTKRSGKSKWKPILAGLVVVAIAYEGVHVFNGGGGKAVKASSSSSPSASATSPIPRPSPSTRVTLGGHSVAASGQPILLLNPGLVAPGGQVSVQGSGFDPGSTVVVRLVAKRSSQGTEVAMGKINKTGSLFTQFTMPSSASGSGATVVAQEQGSSKSATAQLVSPAGAASASIVGKAAGQPGNTVTVSATGFGPGETVNVFWGRMNGTPAATLTADGSGSISRASVKVGVAPVGPTTLVLVGTKTAATATAPYQMLGLYPSTTPHPYAVLSGKTMTYTGTGFAPGERVLIYFNASGGMPALTVQANSDGNFSTSFVVPFGLTGRQTLTAIGEQSRAAVTTGFSVLPYTPSAQVSTYGAMPGTTVSFYASGFAPDEVVMVYLGRGQGNSGQLVSAFRVDGRGNAAAAGKYVIPNGTGPGLYFTMVGQHSGGTATAKVSVTAPAQPVTVPSQPPYTLPPSLGGTSSAQPSAGQSSGSQPSAGQSSGSQPSAGQTSGSQPSADQTSGSQPSADQTSGSQPSADQPTASQPAAGS